MSAHNGLFCRSLCRSGEIMNLLEIIMLIFGILIIIFSCRIVAQPDKKKNGISIDSSDVKDIFMHEELHIFKEQQNELLNSASEEAIAKTDDYLSKLSNEKIMAVSEYSDQILDKITQNHEEVVFLYNMLNNKEKELQETVRVINNSQQKAMEPVSDNSGNKESDNDAFKPKQIDTQARNIKLKHFEDTSLEQISNKQSTISINNSEILKQHEQGKSVLDIAKQMGIGQGEVKLVIDLFVNR